MKLKDLLVIIGAAVAVVISILAENYRLVTVFVLTLVLTALLFTIERLARRKRRAEGKSVYLFLFSIAEYVAHHFGEQRGSPVWLEKRFFMQQMPMFRDYSYSKGGELIVSEGQGGTDEQKQIIRVKVTTEGDVSIIYSDPKWCGPDKMERQLVAPDNQSSDCLIYYVSGEIIRLITECKERKPE
ncbi:MAG: hypothetical protein WC519_01645 [Parcubacteria group bacterium]